MHQRQLAEELDAALEREATCLRVTDESRHAQLVRTCAAVRIRVRRGRLASQREYLQRECMGSDYMMPTYTRLLVCRINVHHDAGGTRTAAL